ncbi:MAG: SigE family RNA polymerase sigma factor [Ilumatobacteraceae bacterium]|nr:SigE family RNA polymerase sigma factor [Ilumatobacteraceae bacterium]
MLTNGEVPAVITIDFESFYVATGRRMLSLAYSLTGNWGDAEDLVQEAYAAAHRRWSVVGTYEDPAGWVRRVITNRAVSRWRRLSHELNVRQRLAARPAQTSTTAEPVNDAFWQAVRALPRQQMAVVVLYYVEDQSVDAIAAVLGCAAGTVKTQLFRARRSLADRLGAQMEEEHDA